MATFRLSYIDAAGNERHITDGVSVFLQPNWGVGLGVLPVELPGQQRPYRDGICRTGRCYTPSRDITIGLNIRSASQAGVLAIYNNLATWLNAYLNASTSGSLRIHLPDGRFRQIDGIISSLSDPAWSGPAFATLYLGFRAPSPWFYDPAQASETFGLGSPGGVTFPIVFAPGPGAGAGITFSASDLDVVITINNGGQVATWPTIVVNGPGVNPTITNDTTGALIALTGDGGISLDAGDTVTIDMDAATIDLYDASAGTTTPIPQKMSAASEFWTLQPGANDVHCEMSEVTTGSIVVSWYEYYTHGL